MRFIVKLGDINAKNVDKDIICDQCKCGTSTISSQNENENNDEAILAKRGFSMESAHAVLTSYRKIEADFKSKFETV